MIKSVKLAVAVGMVAAVSGCSTITFTNGGEASGEQYSSMHHNVAYSLYEYSEPVAPNETCSNGWSNVTIEKDVVTAIAGGIDSAVLGVDLWDPWAVTVSCAK